MAGRHVPVGLALSGEEWEALRDFLGPDDEEWLERLRAAGRPAALEHDMCPECGGELLPTVSPHSDEECEQARLDSWRAWRDANIPGGE